MSGITNTEIENLFKEAKSRVQVTCDENHVHTARYNCLSGDPRDIAICKLIEQIKEDRAKMREVVKSFEV